MKFFYVIHINDERTKMLFCWISNATLCSIFGFFFLLVALASLAQHVHSWLEYQHIFLCHSNISSSANFSQQFLSVDIIIFDYGLFHDILGMSECVANYLDGGYMRGLWCVEHTSVLILMYIGLMFKRYWLMVPCVLMHSIYGLGLTVLTTATVPNVLQAMSVMTQTLLIQLGIFYAGFFINWLFTLILWHQYWAMEEFAALRTRGMHSNV